MPDPRDGNDTRVAPLNVVIKNRDDGENVDVALTGELDPASMSQLRAQMLKLVAIRNPTVLRLDLSGLSARAPELSPVCDEIELAAKQAGGELLVIDEPSPEQAARRQE